MQCFTKCVSLIGIIIYRERVSYTPMGNYVPQGNFLQVNQTNTLIWRGIGSYTSPSPLSVISYDARASPSALSSAHLHTPWNWLKILPAWAALAPCLSLHEANLLIQALIIVAEMQDNLLPSGHDRSNLAP